MIAFSNPRPKFNDFDGVPSRGAKHMLDLGFKIFPLKANRKEPLYAGWKESSKTNDHGTIESLYGNENFAVHPGLTGHFIVDVDNKAGKAGSATWIALQREYGEVPETFTVETPTGGFHLYFKGAGGNTIGAVGKDIDTRGLNGYVVAPGSVIGDKRYRITNPVPVADAPRWLIDLAQPKTAPVLERPAIAQLDAPTEIERAIAYLREASPAIEGQGGDAQTYKVACGLNDLGISRETALEMMLTHFNPRCVPEWSPERMETKVNNAYNYAQNSLGAKSNEAVTASAVSDFANAPVAPAPIPPDFSALDAMLVASRFSLSNPPTRTEPVLWVGDVGVAKPGDIVALQAKVKAGKSSVVGAMMACMLAAPGSDYDFLGFRGANPESLPILHIDTEQSREDHYDLVKRTLDRAGLAQPPAFFYSYCVTHFGIEERNRALFYEAEKLFKRHGGLCAIFLDGVGDLCKNLNDELEANKLVDRLYRVALNYGCPFINVLHENPGTEIGKTRGHFGSQLERKAASNLRLEKNASTGVIQLWGEKLRRGHIGKADGPSFVWSAEENMHISCVSAHQVDELEAAKAFESEREKCLRFLRDTLPAIGDKIRASELNDRAVKLRLDFAGGKASRFASRLKTLLAGGEPEFRISNDGGATSPIVIERLSQPFSDLI